MLYLMLLLNYLYLIQIISVADASVQVADVEPLTVNDEMKVALVAVELFVLISYNPELFIIMVYQLII